MSSFNKEHLCNITKVMSVNVIQFVSSVIVSFIVPSILSIDGYANVKTYTFYLTYIGIFHFGFIDGLFIKYGGKIYSDIDYSVLKGEHFILFIIEFIISIILLVISIFIKNILVFLLSISIIPIAFTELNKQIFQATGEFRKLTRIILVYSIVYLLFNIVLVLVLQNENYIFYCLCSFFSNLITFLLFELLFLKDKKMYKVKFPKDFLHTFKIGAYILIANLSVNLFYALDRWFIKLFYTIKDFAYYSFSISMLNIVNVLINSLAVVFYNRIAKEENISELKKLKIILNIIGVLSMSTFFIFAFVINSYLPQFNNALKIIAISFSSFPFMLVINVIYINLYKTRKQEKKYAKVVFQMVTISFICNTIATVFWHTAEAIATATFISFLLWYLHTNRDFNYLNIKLKDFLYLTCSVFSFIFISNKFEPIIGLMIFLFIILILLILFYGKSFIRNLNKIDLEK